MTFRLQSRSTEASLHDPKLADASSEPTPRPPSPSSARPRTEKWRPRAQLRAVVPDVAEVSDWASFFGDLSRPSQVGASSPPVEWRVHDKTHLEFAIDYPLASTRVWEAYFFVPESFRIHEETYSKKAIYEDLQSYVRYAVPETPFEQLTFAGEGSLLGRAASALARAAGASGDGAEAREATYLLRLHACLVRASGLDAVREIERRLDEALEPDALRAEALAFVARCDELARRLRAVVEETEARAVPDEVRFALRWVDEATSITLEALCAELAMRLERDRRVDEALPELAEQVASHAVSQASYRKARGYDSVGHAHASKRAVEHFEFRRHVLKRFTASALWLSLEVREGRWWAIHVFYAFAAAIAMAFAVAAAFGTSHFSASVVRYGLLVVVAYAVKDRMKAFLQDYFHRWVAARFPDRLWSLRDRERGREVGEVRERAGFVPFERLPAGVLATRRLTREHALEEVARAERVLWHEKQVRVAATTPGEFPMLTEIFRLNIGHWLAHTDDPKRKVLFADPDDASVYSAVARRVYNVGVVYRLRGEGEDAAWHRIRVVVSRKGILRIEPIC